MQRRACWVRDESMYPVLIRFPFFTKLTAKLTASLAEIPT